MRIEYLNVNTNKLHDELINAEIVPLLVESKDDKTWITFADDTDMTAVQSVIEAHNPEPLPMPLTDNGILQQKVAQLEQIIDTMLTGGTI